MLYNSIVNTVQYIVQGRAVHCAVQCSAVELTVIDQLLFPLPKGSDQSTQRLCNNQTINCKHCKRAIICSERGL